MDRFSRVEGMEIKQSELSFGFRLQTLVDGKIIYADITALRGLDFVNYPHGLCIGNVIQNLRDYCDEIEKRYDEGAKGVHGSTANNPRAKE